MSAKEGFVIAANHVGGKVFAAGAKVTVLDPNRGNGGENMYVRGHSRGGRVVDMWVRGKQLYNFRPRWAPKPDWVFYDSRVEAQLAADWLNGWRPFKSAFESSLVLT